MTFRIGVIGCGWVSTACHGPAYREYASFHPGVELAACCDPDAGRVESFRAAFGFQKCYLDYQEMLEGERLDAICLNVPPALTCELGCAILQRRIPLLTEKPPGLTTRELDQLIDAAEAGKVPHQVAFNRRFAPLMTELKRQLANLQIHHVDYTQARVGRDHEDFSTTAVHAIDTTHFLAGKYYREVHMDYQEIQGEPGPFLNYQLYGVYAGGATFHITVCPSSGVSIERAAIYCGDHTFFLSNNLGPDAPGRLLHYEKSRLAADLNAETFCGRSENYYLSGFYQEDAVFFDQVQAGLPITADFHSACQSVALMEALRVKKIEVVLP